MEQLNKVELRGIVGNVCGNSVGGQVITRLTVATNLIYKDKDGYAVIETTWHNVVLFSKTFPSINKNDHVEVIGRIRNQRYTNAEGKEVTTFEILAKYVKVLSSEEPFTLENA